MRGVLDRNDKAPDFELPTQSGGIFRLYEQLKSGPIVLYFYPKDFTPGCTAEACEFRDMSGEFLKRGFRVFGVSSDPPESHMRFIEKHHLNFTLLSDIDGKVRKLFNVRPTLGLLPGRTTFIIDRDGTILGRFSSQLRAGEHPKKMLELIDHTA